jgi:glycosyltransferase involved in cell wall biosynthesis
MREELQIAPDEMLLVFFGFVYASKGVETLLRALAAVQQGRRVSLMVLGEVSEADYGESLSRLVADLSIGRRVRWLGYQDDPSRFLRAADIAVFPFDAGVQLNNSSFACAAAYGLPIIATRGGDTEEEFRHGENAWLCPPQEPGMLADAIVALAENPDLRERLARGGERFVTEHASLEHTISTTVATLHLAQEDLARRWRE